MHMCMLCNGITFANRCLILGKEVARKYLGNINILLKRTS